MTRLRTSGTPAILRAILIAGLLFQITQASRADAAKQADPKPATTQLEILSVYAGRWTSRVKGEATDMIPEAYEYTDRWTGRWVLAGQFLRLEGSTDRLTYTWMFTYDPKEKV